LGSNSTFGAPTNQWTKNDQHLPGAVTRARNLRRRMTLPEKLLWAELRELDLNIRRQAPIGRFIADFIHHPTALVVEIDSARHDLTEDQLYDVERTQWLNANGYQVLRYRNDEVIANAEGIANQIRVAIAFPRPLGPSLIDAGTPG
jgi:very-short-patch-repair endonuclease